MRHTGLALLTGLMVPYAWAADDDGDGCQDAPFDDTGACIGAGASVDPTSTTTGATVVGAGASVGPFVALDDVHIGARATLDGWQAHGIQPLTVGAGSVIGRRVSLGPDHILAADTTLSRAVTAGPRLTTGVLTSVGYASVLGSDVTLNDGAAVGSLVTLGDFTRVGPGAVIARGSTVADAVSMAERTQILGIVGPDVTLGVGVLVSTTARVRKNATIESQAQLMNGARVGRGAVIEAGAVVQGSVRAGGRVCEGDAVGANESVARGMTSQGTPTCAPPSIAGGTHTVDLPTSQSMTFRGIPAGTFEMGCEEGRDDTNGADCSRVDRPWDGVGLHTVTLTNDLWCGQTEVTQAQFMALTPDHHNPSYHSATGRGPDTGVDSPVEQVSWHDAAWYANELTLTENANTGSFLTLCYSCNGGYDEGNGGAPDCTPVANVYACTGYRLPTEAEWEYAARGGESHAYSGGDVANDVSWNLGNNTPDGTKTVGQKPAFGNGYGLYDMSGNVREWVNDWYNGGIYDPSDDTNPLGPQTGSARIQRGGRFNENARSVRVAVRRDTTPDNRDHRYGFRLCRSGP